MNKKSKSYKLIIPFAVIILLIFSTLISYFFMPLSQGAKIFFGVPFVSFLPGFLFVVFFLKPDTLTEKIVLSLAISISTILLILFYLNFLNFKISFLNAVLAASFFCFLVVFYGVLKRLGESSARFSFFSSFFYKFLLLPIFSLSLITAIFYFSIKSSQPLVEAMTFREQPLPASPELKPKTKLFIKYSSDADLEGFLSKINKEEFNIVKEDMLPDEERAIYYGSSFSAEASKIGEATSIKAVEKEQKEGIIVVLGKTGINQDLDKTLKIKIENGTEITGLAAKSSDELKKQGFESADIGNADKTDYKNSIVYYKNDNLKTVGEEIIKIIGKKDFTLEVDPSIETDILVILGENE